MFSTKISSAYAYNNLPFKFILDAFSSFYLEVPSHEFFFLSQ